MCVCVCVCVCHPLWCMGVAHSNSRLLVTSTSADKPLICLLLQPATTITTVTGATLLDTHTWAPLTQQPNTTESANRILYHFWEQVGSTPTARVILNTTRHALRPLLPTKKLPRHKLLLLMHNTPAVPIFDTANE